MSDRLAGPFLFPREAFPMTIEAYGPGVETPYWVETIEAPEGLAALYVPPARDYGVERCVKVRITWADGQQVDTWADGQQVETRYG
jgi:hypothetical protein